MIAARPTDKATAIGGPHDAPHRSTPPYTDCGPAALGTGRRMSTGGPLETEVANPDSCRRPTGMQSPRGCNLTAKSRPAPSGKAQECLRPSSIRSRLPRINACRREFKTGHHAPPLRGPTSVAFHASFTKDLKSRRAMAGRDAPSLAALAISLRACARSPPSEIRL